MCCPLFLLGEKAFLFNRLSSLPDVGRADKSQTRFLFHIHTAQVSIARRVLVAVQMS